MPLLLAIWKCNWNQKSCLFFSLSECMTVSARDGEYEYRATGDASESGGETCGFFIVGDADQIVLVEMTELDVSCGDGGLVVASTKFHATSCLIF